MSKEAWQHHDQIMQVQPDRSVYWGLQNTYEEADEFRVTDPELTPEEFINEAADVIISTYTTLKLAGISYEEFDAALFRKMDLVVHRLVQSEEMSRDGRMTRMEAYNLIKSWEKK